MGAMVRMAWLTSRQERPAMEPESSIRKTVSKFARAAKGESAAGAGVAEPDAYGFVAGEVELPRP